MRKGNENSTTKKHDKTQGASNINDNDISEEIEIDLDLVDTEDETSDYFEDEINQSLEKIVWRSNSMDDLMSNIQEKTNSLTNFEKRSRLQDMILHMNDSEMEFNNFETLLSPQKMEREVCYNNNEM
jgi:hypothetical protein